MSDATKRKDKSGSTPSIPDYEPSAAEAEALRAYASASKTRAPRIKVSGKNVRPDHPSQGVAQIALMKAIGTTHADFYSGLISQLVNVGSPGPEPDEAGTNFMLAIVKGIEPRDQIEAMLAAQMGAVHLATMTFARRLAHVENVPQQDSAERAFNKLARTFTAQVAALKDYRSRGEQKMTVQHVHVAEGGQAIVGNVNAPTPEGGGRAEKSRNNPMRLPMHLACRCRARSKRSGLQCQAPAVRGYEVCRMHGAGGGAPKGNKNALRHGLFAGEAIATRRGVAELTKQARTLADRI